MKNFKHTEKFSPNILMIGHVLILIIKYLNTVKKIILKLYLGI